VVLAWSWMVLNEISQIIINPSLPPGSLVMSIITGIIIIVASGLTTHFLSRKYREFFKEKEEKTRKKAQKSEDTDEESSS